jgi:hypothetical protein
LNSWALTKLTTSNWNIRIWAISLSWLGTATILESYILSKVYQISYLINDMSSRFEKVYIISLALYVTSKSLHLLFDDEQTE